ncbi:MAG: ABC transporter substrate binding protein [Desulfocapsaceae bacterium]|nr:ABC transporter substrate binding protein [Desulfocapsaceae bacterium]
MKHGHHISVRILFFLALLALLPTTTAWGEECVLLQSSALKPYEEARQGFEQAWMTQQPFSGPKSITLGTVAQVVLSEQPEETMSALKKQVENAQLVVVIGDPALNFVRDLQQTPVLFLLAPSAGELPANFTGIDLRILPSRQLEAMSRLMPNLHRIGALYNPAQSGQWVQEALMSQVSAVETLLFKKVSSPALVPEALNSLAHNTIDAYWLLPDDLVTNPQALHTLREFSIANHIPIVSFSEKYLKAGAAVAITFDMADMGRQAADMAVRILGGTKPDAIPVEPPRRQRVIVNTNVLRRMGVVINEAAVDEIYSGGVEP